MRLVEVNWTPTLRKLWCKCKIKSMESGLRTIEIDLNEYMRDLPDFRQEELCIEMLKGRLNDIVYYIHGFDSLVQEP